MNLAPHPFSLRQLQYVVAVADTLSFGGAAARCHVSQPSLSAQVALLEDVLGARLFERDRRRVLLTVAGREIVERARAVLREADDLVDLARRASDPFAGTLRLGVIPTISPYLVPHAGAALRRAYPRLSVMWHEDKTDALVRALADGTIDAALVALEADLGEVEHEEIASDPFVLATAADHPLGAKAVPAKPAELCDASVLLLDDGHCFREQALAFCASAKAHELAFRATSLSTLTQMVADGAGVTLLPQLAVPTEARRADIRVRPFARPAPKRTIALVWRPRCPLAPAFRRIAATVREAHRQASGHAVRALRSDRPSRGGGSRARARDSPARRCDGPPPGAR
jgi:LysR family hydrogen peroxide-inducible transcriptional activator